jgi:hypothetical protein
MQKYIPYIPISKNPYFESYVPEELAQIQEEAKKTIPSKIRNNWDKWLSDNLSLTEEELWKRFSAEQLDSIGLAILKIQKKSGFIIADETGLGKGRILAGVAQYALKNNLNVIFFSEKKELFSDFYRDLTHTGGLEFLDNPIVFHSNAKVYDLEANLVFKQTPTSMKKVLNNKELKTNFVFSTYSQVNAKQNKDKMEFLEKIAKNAIILLDESHNAAGESNTQKFMHKLIEKSKGVVFSSATYIKNENELELYSQALDFTKENLTTLRQLLMEENNYLLRKYFTYELTKSFSIWRREHKPSDIKWQHIVIEDETINDTASQYAEIMDCLFQLIKEVQKTPEFNATHDLINSAWYSLGATVSRLSRNLLLVLKIEELITQIKHNKEANRKSVIVLESTFSSVIEKIIDSKSFTEDVMDSYQEEDSNLQEGESYNISFRNIFIWLFKQVFEESLDNIEQLSNSNISVYKNQFFELVNSFPTLPISPIDHIIKRLNDEKIECGEISGRIFTLEEQEDQSFIIKKIQDNNRVLTVKKFNDGVIDVIVLTRAGASGISLHASKDFKDQRQRVLFELEITNRPTFRLQFIGRVKRKNQACEPLFYTICTQLPFEKRIIANENEKLKVLQSHLTGDEDKHDIENIIDFYNREMDQLAKDYLINDRNLAFKLGIGLKVVSNDFYYIDSLLKRCVILNNEEQVKILSYLSNGAQIIALKNSTNASLSTEVIDIKTLWHELNEQAQKEFKEEFQLFNNKDRFLNQFKYDWVSFVTVENTYEIKNQTQLTLEPTLKQNQKKYPLSTYYKFWNRFYAKRMVLSASEDEKKQILRNSNQMKNLEVGNYISYIDDKNHNKIHGYVEDITYPTEESNAIYPTQYMITIRTVNPEFIGKNGNVEQIIFNDLHSLISNEHLTVYQNDTIDWKKFETMNKKIVKQKQYFMGNPLWIHYLKKVYHLGITKRVLINNKNYIAVEIPQDYNIEKIREYRKPLINFNNIMDKLIKKEIHTITTSYNKLPPALRITPVTGGYNMFVHYSVVANKEIFDFPLKQKLGTFTTYQEYEVYKIPYKNLRTILAMLEKRNIIWFIEK